MGSSTLNNLVGERDTREALYRTIQATNKAGSIEPNGTIEDIEELESRGLNPYWDKALFRKQLEQEASKNGLLITKNYLEKLTIIHDKKANGTAENDVYISDDNRTVTKVNDLSYIINGDNNNNLSAFFDRITAHNELYYSDPYIDFLVQIL